MSNDIEGVVERLRQLAEDADGDYPAKLALDAITLIEGMTKALEPFAKLADATYGGVGLTMDSYVTLQIKLDDLRRARDMATPGTPSSLQNEKGPPVS